MSVEFEAAESLRHIALDKKVKSYVLQHPPLYQALRHAAMRFIGGETLTQCVKITKSLNEQGHAVTIDFMGESTRDASLAEQATQEFLNVVRAITVHNLNASVSLDLSHIGMAIDMETLLRSGHSCSIATHDQSLLSYAHKLIQDQSLASDKTEFEMLQGVTPERLKTMNNCGYRTRVYLPYGKEWHLYLCNRLAEYPPKIYQAIVDVVKHGHE